MGTARSPIGGVEKEYSHLSVRYGLKVAFGQGDAPLRQRKGPRRKSVSSTIVSVVTFSAVRRSLVSGLTWAAVLATLTSCVPAAERSTDPPGASPPPQSSEEGSRGGTALAALAALPVKGRAPMTGYDRRAFGPEWLDADRNGCDTRNDVLGRYLRQRSYERGTSRCVVEAGVLNDRYTGTKITFLRGDGVDVDIDHVVSLGNAWTTGAFSWRLRKRAAFANDALNLLPADASANRQKGDADAATWLPPNHAFRCRYVARQVAVKGKYGLWATRSERAAIERILEGCPGQSLPADSGAPTRVPVGADATPSRTESAPAERGGSVYFDTCDAARAAGAAPVRRGDRGYGRHLDRDGDGTGCE